MGKIDEKRDHFFLRNALWLWHDNQTIDIVNEKMEIVLTLNLWETLVYHEAVGGQTVSDFIRYMKNKEEQPLEIEKLVKATLEKLVFEIGVVLLTKESNDFPLYYELPVNELDCKTLDDIKKMGIFNGG